MSDYLYYCAKCNSLVADAYDDEELACEKCGSSMTPLHIDEDEWNAMSGNEKKSMIMDVRNPKPKQPRRRQISMDDFDDLDDDFEEVQEERSQYQQQRIQGRPQGQYYGGQQQPRQKQVQIRRPAPQQQRQYNRPQNTVDYNGRISQLSIAAMVLAVLGCTGFIGIILAIIDLTKNDGRKKGLSIAAIIVALVMTGVFASVANQNSDKNDNKAETTVVSETAEETKIEEPTVVPETITDNNEDTEKEASSSNAAHEVVDKPSDSEIEEVGRLYLHEHADDYVGKWVRFAGKIVGINKENMQLDLEGPATLKTLYCNMMNDQDISSYNYDDYVTIVGRMDYKMIGQVMINNCYVEDTGDTAKDTDERLAAEYPVSNSSSGGSLFGTSDLDTSNAIETTAKTVYKEMQDNQVACKTKYDGKTVKMKGIVENIGTNIYGQEYVTFETGDPYSFEGVQIFFKNDQMDYVASLKKGDTITVYGVAGIGSMTFKMGNCFPAED